MLGTTILGNPHLLGVFYWISTHLLPPRLTSLPPPRRCAVGVRSPTSLPSSPSYGMPIGFAGSSDVEFPGFPETKPSWIGTPQNPDKTKSFNFEGHTSHPSFNSSPPSKNMVGSDDPASCWVSGTFQVRTIKLPYGIVRVPFK